QAKLPDRRSHHRVPHMIRNVRQPRKHHDQQSDDDRKRMIRVLRCWLLERGHAIRHRLHTKTTLALLSCCFCSAALAQTGIAAFRLEIAREHELLPHPRYFLEKSTPKQQFPTPGVPLQ